MAKLRPHLLVADDFLATAKNVVTTQRIAVPALVVFDSLAGADDWTDWLGLDSVTYTTPEPRGIGTKRIVTSGRTTIHEEFFAWQRPCRLAFRAASSTLPVRGFAENYAITEESDASCVLTWTVALEGRSRLLTPLVLWVMGRLGRRTLPKLATLLESRPI